MSSLELLEFYLACDRFYLKLLRSIIQKLRPAILLTILALIGCF